MKHLGFQFTPLQDFSSAELQSFYLVGLNYTVRADCELLDTFIDGWLAEGKIIAFDGNTAKFEGV